MSFAPILPWWFLTLLGLAAVVVGLWFGLGKRRERVAWFRRTGIAVLLVLAFLRPGLGGVDARSASSQLDVFFVVDTTSSIMAEDYGKGQPRLAGVQADLNAIAEKLPGAYFSLISFAKDASVVLPLTNDTNALANSVSALRPEVTAYSRGSSVTVAAKTLSTRLAAAKQAHPTRARVVYYLGDGEQTAAAAPAPFDVAPGLISGGAVLGYGTATGGKMKVNTGLGLGPGYIQDYSKGGDAISKVDERLLATLGQQLGVGYVHRNAGDGIGAAMTGVQPGALKIDGQSSARAQFELYWVLSLGVVILAGWELFASLKDLRRMMPGKKSAFWSTKPRGGNR